MQVLIDRLAEKLPADAVRLNTVVESIHCEPASGKWTGQYHRAVAGGYSIETTSGETIRADGICIALPAYATARLVRLTNAALADELEAISYASTATVNLAYKRADIPHALDGFGFVVPFIEQRSIIACTFSSVKFAGRAPENHALLRAFVGGAMQPEMFELDDKEMIRRVQDDLRDLLGIKEPPLFTALTRWSRSMPQYEIGHLERVGRIEEHLSSLPGLRLAGNAYGGAGIPDCIRSGETAAKLLYDELTEQE